MFENKNILISGAGITGLTLAYWLHKWGFSPTIIEKRPELSDRGYMIDFYGSGFDVADKMGLVDTLQARSVVGENPIIRVRDTLIFCDQVHSARPTAGKEPWSGPIYEVKVFKWMLVG